MFWTCFSKRVCVCSGIPWNALCKGKAIMMSVMLKKVLMQNVPQLKAVMLKVLWAEHGWIIEGIKWGSIEAWWETAHWPEFSVCLEALVSAPFSNNDRGRTWLKAKVFLHILDSFTSFSQHCFASFDIWQLVIDHKILDVFQIKCLFFQLAQCGLATVAHRHIEEYRCDTARDMLTFYGRNNQEKHSEHIRNKHNLRFWFLCLSQVETFVDVYSIQ